MKFIRKSARSINTEWGTEHFEKNSLMSGLTRPAIPAGKQLAAAFFDFVKFRGIDSAVSLSKDADTEEVLEWLSLGKEVSVWKSPHFHVC